MEDALIEVESMRRFAHLHLAKGWIPDASTILAFRHFLEEHDLGAKLFERVGEYEQGLLLREGTVVDATIIHAPTSNSSDVVVASELLHGEEKVNAGYQGLQKREETEGKEVECGIAMGPVNRRRLPATAEGELLRWAERAQAHIRAKVETRSVSSSNSLVFAEPGYEAWPKITAR